MRFTSWTGLTKPPSVAMWIALAAALALLLVKLPLLWWTARVETVTGGGTVTGALSEGLQFQLELALAFFLLLAMSGSMIGHVNEKFGRSSIAPGWLIRGAGNATWYYLLAFEI